MFGVRSAMPAMRAERLCPQLVFVPPDFVRYKAVSRQIREIFARHTELIEPLSLDEAYLDVTVTRSGLPSATATAEAIRAAIREETGLTASAGVAPNKFLAKIASDWNKPDGLCVIRPHQVEAFLTPLPVGRLPGVGKVMEAKLAAWASAPSASCGSTRGGTGACASVAGADACTSWRAASTSMRCSRSGRPCRSPPRTRSSTTCCWTSSSRISAGSPKRPGPATCAATAVASADAWRAPSC